MVHRGLHILNSHNKFSEVCLKEGFFARHETFCPRYGWLKKGFDAVLEDPGIFDRADDIERLGVGKNMVRSIRFWCMAFHVIEPAIESGQRRLGGDMRVTPFGRALLSDDGWDPFLEDPASLWLLHWQLFSPPITATTWSIAVNLGHIGSFTLKELDQAIKERMNSHTGLKRCSDSSVEKDASCFIRMYAPPGIQRLSEEIECPFTDLGLLLTSEEKQAFRFNMADKSTLPEEVFLAACCDYIQKSWMLDLPRQGLGSARGVKSLSLNKATFHFNSPGAVFKLSETNVGYRLEQIRHRFPDDVHIDDQYGSLQIQFLREPQDLFCRALDQSYGSEAGAKYH